MDSQLTDAQVDQIRKKIGDGRKLDACKLYRGFTGSSLREAKQFVDNLSSGDPSRSEAAEGSEEALVEQILDLLEAGCKLDAVRIYKDHTGKSILESKTFIESLIDEFEILEKPNSQSGCAGLILIFVVWGFILQSML